MGRLGEFNARNCDWAFYMEAVPKPSVCLTQHTELVDGLCMCCCVSSMVSRYIDYTAEAYGLYLALATDSNIPVDFIVRAQVLRVSSAVLLM